MKNALRVVVQRKERPFWQIIVMILASVVLINYLITLCNLLGERYAGIASLGILLISLTLCTLIIIRLLSSFAYILDGDKIVFERLLGNRSNIILSVNLAEITKVSTYSEINNNDNIAYTYKFVCDREYDKMYICDFERDSKKYRFIFKPSDRLLELIEKSIENVSRDSI
ncbi:hypothetical protein [Brassicibacter mesophilus]|uniref:hypothetical protein n=1 Tax=Brassicibacter mesophilus TaxID=745119 RepID=UPI003D207523